MPVATPDQYCKMLDRAFKVASPTRPVTSLTANAAIGCFADKSAMALFKFLLAAVSLCPVALKDTALGSISFAQHVHLVAEKYNILIALHTDHCHPKYLTKFRPL